MVAYTEEEKNIPDKTNESPGAILINALLVLNSFIPIIAFYTIAIIIGEKLKDTIDYDMRSYRKFVIDFVIIVIPTVLFVIIKSSLAIYINIALIVYISYSLYKMHCKDDLRDRFYVNGGERPFAFTLDRSTLSLLVALFIIADQCVEMPNLYKKSRQYGAGLIDVGIGLYVFSTAIVQRRTKTFSKYLLVLTQLFIMSCGHISLVCFFNKKTDVNEFEMYWNGFFTLAFLKLLRIMCRKFCGQRTIPLKFGVALLIYHEFMLYTFTYTYVSDESFKRNTWISANREVLFSFPGFLALYSISAYIGRTIRKQQLVSSYQRTINLIKQLGMTCGILWLLVFFCSFTVSISRVTCNLGYVIWILAIALTMTTLFMLIFHLIQNNNWFTEDKRDDEGEDNNTVFWVEPVVYLPMFLEAINSNGFLCYALAQAFAQALANANKSDFGQFQGVIIITGCAFLLTAAVCMKYRTNFSVTVA
ncbi:unnamed protein product [Ceratitis capitata]|uniref:Phosphatidylinositol-glycan biosynthesis class W protein n=1 Tax=Ceratitis capitata TaxID=7213 RepID=A0A811UMM1_CERCA|nr:unnamed protein product [Ceratitis capitata]